MKIGYIRVSREAQTLALQEDAMKKAQVDKVYHEKVSGVKVDRPELKKAIEFAREGDTIVVWRLDRLGRSLKELITMVTEFREKGIHFQSLTENIDTSTPTGMLIFHVFGALAEFERALIIERTNAGLEAARARGKRGGRRPIKIDSKKIARAKSLYASKTMTVEEIMSVVGIKNRVTFYKYVVNA